MAMRFSNRCYIGGANHYNFINGFRRILFFQINIHCNSFITFSINNMPIFKSACTPNNDIK